MSKVICENAKNKEEWFDYVFNLIFNEWIKGDNNLFVLKKNKMLKDDLVRPYILLDNNVPVGCFLIAYNDIKGYPKYNPNLACVCIENKYRGKGYSNYILKYSIEVLKELGIAVAYLKTNLKGFYEKVGWIPLNEFCGEEMIYKLTLIS